MERPQWLTDRRLWRAAGLLGPLMVAALLNAARDWVPNTDAALVMVVVVVAVAVSGDRVAGTLAAVSAAAWFDFFLTVPYFQFSISGSRDVQTTGLLLLVGLSVTEIAVRAAHHRRTAVEEAAHLALIGSVSQRTLDAASETELIARVQAELPALLGARKAVLLPPGERSATTPVLHHDGRITWGQISWQVQDQGLPNVPVALPLHSGGHDLGAFLIHEGRRDPVPSERLVVAGVLADQVANALTLHSTGRATP